ncbi:MAG TPA: Gfo/Idh/MocA family oxidoreductase [Tepidisphaeraceae bacterium]|jgi:myo-inositol 2-dehydrogenase/D-chiro-inositol 1-dehydrogenase
MDRVKFGLIGYGAWGGHHARAIEENPRAQLRAVAARTNSTLERACNEVPSAALYTDYHAMLAREDLDAVVIVLPTDLHFEASRAVLESGRHLLLEKPMALTLEHCDALTALAAETGKILAVGHEFRLSSLWGKIKQIIDEGGVGEPLYELIELWRRPYRLGADGWRYDINRVGNWILEEPIHFFDLARWYFQRLGDPVSVFAQASASRPDRPELQDNFSAMLRFPSGAYAVISQTLVGWEHHQVVKVTGREGALWAGWSGAMDRTFEPTFFLKHRRGDRVADVPLTKVTGEVFELRDQVEMMIRAIADGTPPAATGADGRWSVAMCLKAQESVDRGAEVKF